MEYYCTKSAIEFLKLTTPDKIEEYTSMEDDPQENIVIVENEIGTVYIMTIDDFQKDSFIFNEKVTVIEYFENGIPDYLLPKRGLTYYYCTWDGQWTFTKDYRK